MADDHPLEQALAQIGDAADGETLSAGDLLDAFEDRSLGFVLLVFGLLVALPVIGAIPGMPVLSALVVLASVGASVAGVRRRLWAPEIIRARRMGAARVRAVLARLRPYAARIDGLVINRRLAVLVDGAGPRLAVALTAGALAPVMVVLGLVPGFAALPAIALVLLGLGLMGRDGLFVLAGYALTAASAALLVSAWQSLF